MTERNIDQFIKNAKYARDQLDAFINDAENSTLVLQCVSQETFDRIGDYVMSPVRDIGILRQAAIIPLHKRGLSNQQIAVITKLDLSIVSDTVFQHQVSNYERDMTERLLSQVPEKLQKSTLMDFDKVLSARAKSALNFSLSGRNYLIKYLAIVTEDQVFKQGGVGEKTKSEIRQFMQSIGIEFRDANTVVNY